MKTIKRRYLITGVATTGKSTICRELLLRGLPAFDTEAISHWVDSRTGQPAHYHPGDGQKVLERIEWRLKPDKLELLLESRPDLVLCGLSANQGDYFHLFNKIFMLVTDEATLRFRLANRTYKHAFGTDLTERKIVLATYKDWQEKTRAQGAIVIEVNRPLNKTVDTIIEKIQFYGK